MVESWRMRRRHFLLGLPALLAGLWNPLRQTDRTGRAATKPIESEAVRRSPLRMLIAAAGDTVLGFNLQDHVDAQLEAGIMREQLWPLYFGGVQEILAKADLTVLNLECPFTERGDRFVKNFNFQARPELIDILKAGLVNVVSLANNHVMDYGGIGLEDTLNTLDGAGIAHFGAGATLARARTPAILERQGIKVGFLGYYFQTAADMLEPPGIYATKDSSGVAGCYIDLNCIRQQISEDVQKLVRRVEAVIPYFHWGKEGTTEVRDYQKALAHLCIDLGCKAVLGAHPHKFQGVEVYRNAPIFYSLGNFVYGGKKNPSDKLSAIALLHVTPNGAITAEIEPIEVTRWPEAPFQPFLLRETARTEALAYIASLSAGFPSTLPMLQAYLKS
jgi:poly-gamma-glutamate capsule biosynthesis protein CapA/YwtB (metallophosphatase superfamily)